jgi:hypothetical protein
VKQIDPDRKLEDKQIQIKRRIDLPIIRDGDIITTIVGEGAAPSDLAKKTKSTHQSSQLHPLELRLLHGHGRQHLVEILLHEDSMHQRLNTYRQNGELNRGTKESLDPNK